MQSELDECGGRFGITPDYPNGTYYYVLTDNWPYIPRCLKGRFIDNSFRLGQNCPASTAATDCSTTSTEELLSKEVNVIVFPNPTSDYVRIALDDGLSAGDVTSIKLFNNAAALVYSSASYQDAISVKGMVAGTYFIQINFGEIQITEAVIIQ